MSKVDLRRDSEKRLKIKVGRKHKRDAKLQELEKQLEFAESRCGTLKQQLDYIKLLYGCGKSENVEKQPSKEEGRGDGCNVPQLGYAEMTRWQTTAYKENCLDYVNQAVSQTNSNSTHSNNKVLTSSRDKADSKRKYHSKQKTHFKLLKVKKKSSKKGKKRRRGEDALSSKMSNASSQTQSQIWHDPVVEIYKNSALNVESESGFEIICKKNKIIKTNEILGKQKASARYDGSEDSKAKSCNALNGKKGGVQKEEGIQTEISIESSQSPKNKRNEEVFKENSIKTENTFYEPVKGYCQPTISSKRKQVDRDIYSNLTNINVRNIPFVVARSTTPSHNIGVNIQQVLSILKKRTPINEPPSETTGNHENPLVTLLSSKKIGNKNEAEPNCELTGTVVPGSSESKKRTSVNRTSLSHWKSNSDFTKEKAVNLGEKVEEPEDQEWNSKVDKLKKVLVFLHEDFTFLSQKYKKLQKKLTKRNITKTDAKDELADIERDLEKKEEEITVVIGLYKEVLSLREDLKKLQEKYNLVACGRTLFEGLRQSNSTHTQMTTLLRKIQNFQDQLKG